MIDPLLCCRCGKHVPSDPDGPHQCLDADVERRRSQLHDLARRAVDERMREIVSNVAGGDLGVMWRPGDVETLLLAIWMDGRG